MKIENWVELEVSKLREAEYNPRKISKDKLEQLKHSLTEDPDFLKARPLIVNQREDGSLVVCGGNQRLKAVRDLKWEKVPCVLVKLSLAQEKLWNLKDNKEYGEWDDDLLASLLKELYEGDINLDLSGFDEKEVEKLIGGLYDVMQDEVPPLPVKPKSRRGEVYQLGNHRIMCADCTSKEDMEKLMGDNKAKLLLTDPPYGVDYGNIADSRHRAAVKRQTGKAPKAAGRENWNSIENDDLTDGGIQVFLESCFKVILPHLEKNCAWYLWHAQKTQGFFTAAAAAAAKVIWHRQIVWVKPHLILGRGDYHWRHELLFYGWVEGHRPPFYGERNQTTVWECPTPQDRNHPTQKPLELMLPPIRNHLKEGEICLDPFLGSGTTLIACEQTKRVCFGMEISPQYIDVCIQRFESLTGRKAVKLKN